MVSSPLDISPGLSNSIAFRRKSRSFGGWTWFRHWLNYLLIVWARYICPPVSFPENKDKQVQPWRISVIIKRNGGYEVLLLFSWLVASDSLWPRVLQHARPPCPSPSLRVCPSLCPLNQWYHPTISSSITPFSSCSQSFLALGSFPMSWLYSSSGQSIEASALASVLLDRIVWSPCCQRDSQESSPAPQLKSTDFSAFNLPYGPTLTSIHVLVLSCSVVSNFLQPREL